MNEKKELAQLIKETLNIHGFDGWFTPGYNNVRTNASISETRAIFEEIGYPQHLIKFNTSFSKGGDESFKVLVKVS